MFARFVVYFLMACSAILLFNSYRLESSRIETLIRNSATQTAISRVLPEEDGHQEVLPVVGNAAENTKFYVPSLDYRIKGISQYATTNSNSDTHGIIFEAHVYCQEFEKDLLWEWWRPDKNNENDHDEDDQQQQGFLRKKARRTATETESTMTMMTNGTTTTTTDATTSTSTTTTRKRLLIGVSSGYNDSARLLERAVWSARVYGALWSGSSSSSSSSSSSLEDVDFDVTVVTLQGTAFSPHGCKAPSSYSSIDKIRMLFQALDSKSQYDRLLLLDADAMIYDMDMDLTTLFDNNSGDYGNDNDNIDDFVVAGSPILTKDGKLDKNMPWKIASGMTLWNLEHPLTQTVALDWFNYAKNAIIRTTYKSDQKYLHKALQKQYITNKDGIVSRTDNRAAGVVRTLPNHEFDDDVQGKKVKQFVVVDTTIKKNIDINEADVNDVHDKQVEARLGRMEETARQICARYPDACNQVGAPPRYETS